MAAWKRSTRIDRTCCGGIFTGRFVSLLIKKVSAGQKLRHLLANSFELSMIMINNHCLSFSPNVKVHKLQVAAGDQL